MIEQIQRYDSYLYCGALTASEIEVGLGFYKLEGSGGEEACRGRLAMFVAIAEGRMTVNPPSPF